MPEITSDRPLSALFSQVLVAFTVEFDNEFERRMGEVGYAGARLSLSVWSNLMRFLTEDGLSVRDLAGKALTTHEQIKGELGCLERWVFVFLRPDETDARPIPMRSRRLAGRDLRDGWGSGRGIRAEWIVRLTTKGQKAAEIWPLLFGEIERRWQLRFGDNAMGRLRKSLQDVGAQLELELPHALPGAWLPGDAPDYPARVARDTGTLSLPTLLSQLLLVFALEFQRESRVSLALSANVLRVLGEKPVCLKDIPRLTGGSPETTDIGWQMKPYVVVEADPAAKRGKVLRLSPLGLEAQQTYDRLVGEIEKRWEVRFGRSEIRRLRESLQELFDQRDGNQSRMSAGLVPPPGVVRAGHHAPALGRRDVGVAAKQRMRDLVAQTEEFVRDPTGALPHYPLWDINRGFGP
jgi:DNA-binding MarR family transcriptional regulator